MITPRTAKSEPSVWCPVHSHSDHDRDPTVSSATHRITMSGTPANISVQLAATCVLPVNVRFGCTGCSEW